MSCEPLEDKRLLAVVTDAGDAGDGVCDASCTLRDAAASGDLVITFDTVAMDGYVVTLDGTPVSITNAATIDGGTGVTVDGYGRSQVLNITDGNDPSAINVTLRNMTITGGVSDDRGAGIYTAENLTLEDSVVTGNVSTNQGGGIASTTYAVALDITFIRSEISNNTATDGGGMDIFYGRNLTIVDSVLSDNTAGSLTPNGDGTAGGSALRWFGDAADSIVDISNSQIINNMSLSSADATADGTSLGALFLVGFTNTYTMDVEIRDSIISGNEALCDDLDTDDAYVCDGRGGGLYVTDADTLNIVDTTFDSNYSYGTGGAFSQGSYDRLNTITTDNVTITNNGTSDVGNALEGGGIWFIEFAIDQEIEFDIRNSNISGNGATFGGGVMLRQGPTGSFTNTTFDSNFSQAGGAVFQLADEGLTPQAVNFDSSAITNSDGNISGQTYGGGLAFRGLSAGYDHAPIESTIVNTTISGQILDALSQDDYIGSGAGISLYDGANVTLTHSTITGNQNISFDDGVDMYEALEGAGVHIGRVTAVNVYGGGGRSYLNLDGTIVAGNTRTNLVGDVIPDDIADVDGVVIGDYAPVLGVQSANFSIVGTNDNNDLPTSTLIGSPGSEVDALLGALQLGGFFIPQVGSPAIDAGDPASTVLVDQVGVARPIDDPLAPGGAVNDIGSIEVGGVVVAPCDLDGSGGCDTDDLRVLYDDIAAGTVGGPSDIDGSGLVDNDDIDDWLLLAGTENGKTYLPGDTNLDGNVDGPDFTTLAFNFGNVGLPGAYWDQGNFDGNPGGVFEVGGSDFTALAFNFGFVSAEATTSALRASNRLGIDNLADQGKVARADLSKRNDVVSDVTSSSDLSVPGQIDNQFGAGRVAEVAVAESVTAKPTFELSDAEEREEIADSRLRVASTIADVVFAEL